MIRALSQSVASGRGLHVVFVSTLLALSLGLAPAALGQDVYPSKSIRLLVPFPPGGVTDIIARLIAAKLGDSLKQNVLIDNRAGANGNIAVELVAKSQPDGYTLLFGQVSNLAINPAIYRNIPFDPIKDLAPVALVAQAPQIMVVSAASSFNTVADVMAAAKAKPETVTFASSGNGSMAHMGIELIQLSAGVKFIHVPYKGAAPAVIDVIGGRAEVFMAAVPSVMGQIRGGKIRAVAVTSTTRVADMPDIPTLAESGFPGFEAGNWFAVMGRAGTPSAIIARLNAEVNKAVEAADVKARIASEGGTTLGGTSAQLAAQLAKDLAKWSRVVKDAGIKLE